MSDQDSERRVYPRFAAPKGTIVAWHRFNKRAVSLVDNLGLGGLFIRTPDPPPAGTFIQLLIDAPTGVVRARAAVQRSSPKRNLLCSQKKICKFLSLMFCSTEGQSGSHMIGRVGQRRVAGFE